MLHGKLAVLVIGLALGAPSSGVAQDLVLAPADKAERVADRYALVHDAGRRAVGALDVLNDPRMVAADSAAAYLAALNAVRPGVQKARVDLAAIASEMRALPPVAEQGDPGQMKGADVAALNIARLAEQLDSVLATVDPLIDALRDGRAEEAQVLLRRLGGGSAIAIEAQGIFLRTQGDQAPPGSSEQHLRWALGCLFDGSGAYLQRGYDLIEARVAQAEIASARRCVAENLDAADSALDREADPALPGGLVRQQMNAVARRMSSTLRPMEPLLAQAEADAGKQAEGAQSYFAQLAEIERRFGSLTQEQIAIMRAQPAVSR